MRDVNRKGSRVSRNLLCSAWLVLVAAIAPGCVFADPRTYLFDIPPQELDDALRLYARVSGQQIAYEAATVRGRVSHGLRGQFSPSLALTGLLDGTGLTVSQLRSGVYRIDLPSVPATHGKANAAITLRPMPEPPDAITPPVVIVLGTLPQDYVSYHRRDPQFRDVVATADTDKLPGTTVPDALQHVGGTQGSIDRGEISRINIRGLSEVNTLINGREIYSDTGRNLSLEYVPTNIFADLDIYKNPSAAMIEGGVGGIIDMRTRRPFDSRNPVYALTLKTSRFEHATGATLQATGLYSRRWQTTRGEFGLLVSAATIPNVARLDSIGTEPFASRYDLVDYNGDGSLPGLVPPAPSAQPGDLVIAPKGGGNTSERVARNRTATDIVGQWRPSDSLLLTLELTRLGYKFSRDSYVLYANRGPLLAQPGASFVYSDAPGEGNVVQAGAYRDVVFTSNTNYYDRKTASGQLALSLDWSPTPQTRVTADLSHTRSTRVDGWGGLRIGNAEHAAGTTLTFDVRPDLPVLHLSGINPSDPAIYSLIDSSHSIAFAESTGDALRADVNQSLTAGPVQTIDFGVRWTRRDTLSEAGTRQHLTGELPASLLPQAVQPVPFSDFFYGQVAGSLFAQGILAAPPALVREMTTICRAVHDSVCAPQFETARGYGARETTGALYSQLNYSFSALGLPVTGTTGIRIIQTGRVIFGYQTSNTGVVTPFFSDRHETDILPSLSARMTLGRLLYLRLAVGRQVTRPNFSDLSPTLSFGYANSNTTLTGFAGNPDLRPLKSTAFDLSLEYYFTGRGYTYLTVFRKDMDGFIQAVVRTEPVAFPDFPGYSTAEITRLQNGEGGVITGYQTGFQASLTRLGRVFADMSAQANYTRVNSNAPGPIAGTSVPLVGLSRNSYNLLLSYEKAGIRASLSYTYRDDYVDTIAGPGSGSLPIYSRPYGALDASVGYRIGARAEIGIEGANLGHARQASYFGEPDRPRFVNAGDSRVSIVLRLNN